VVLITSKITFGLFICPTLKTQVQNNAPLLPDSGPLKRGNNYGHGFLNNMNWKVAIIIADFLLNQFVGDNHPTPLRFLQPP
jgi:hypothetical protein